MDLSRILEAFADIVRQPTTNLTAAALLGAIVVIVLLMGILFALLYLLKPIKRPIETTIREPERPADSADSTDSTDSVDVTDSADERAGAGRSGRIDRYTGVLVAVLILAAGVSGYVATGTDLYCAEQCHLDDGVVRDESDPHASLACVRCHSPSGSGDIAAGTLFRTLHALPVYASQQRTTAGGVSSATCLDCHEAVADEIVGEAVYLRMSHAEPLSSGMSCDVCHDSGHRAGEGSIDRASRMSVCLRCHDGVGLPADCDVCHVGDPALASASRRTFVREVVLPPIEDCGGCHEQDTCDDCHGIRLPHTSEFLRTGHAMEAAFDRKELCWRCHEQVDCGPCHGDWLAHGPDLKEDHKRWQRGAHCTGCHSGHEGSFCAVCHGPGW